MKAKVFSMMIGFAAVAQFVMAQSPIYKMNVKMTDGSFFANSSLTTFSHSSKLYGSTTRTELMPIE